MPTWKGIGAQPIFGFFGPAWLINYVMAGNSGGTKAGEGTYGDWAVCNPRQMGFFWGGTWVLANKDSDQEGSRQAKLIDWITLQTGDDKGLQYLLGQWYAERRRRHQGYRRLRHCDGDVQRHARVPRRPEHV